MASGYYDITSKTLGKGHYGVVKLGRHCLTGEPVAIKIIEKARLNKDSLNQLGSEIRILFRLSEYEHPNILKLYQTIETEDKLFLVTEYCGPNACDLHDYLLKKHGRDGLVEQEAQIFFIQICSAISYCHSMGIVHRDLKPENILVTDYRHMQTRPEKTELNLNDMHYPLLKLIDFGFANQWYPDEKMRTSCGTLAYSAPELLLGEPYDGTKVDVWGLGLMLYILLYGGNPFMQLNDNETLTKILDCSFATPLRASVNSNAIDLLRSLIRRNPESRLPIDAILMHKWFSNVCKPLGVTPKYQLRQLEQTVNSRQLNCNKLAPVVSPTLPSISEIRPLKESIASINHDQDSESADISLEISQPSILNSSFEMLNLPPKCNRTRSLSITRIHNKPVHQKSLPQTRSSINLGRLFSNHNYTGNITLSPISSPPSSLNSMKSTSIYRPTSPDVGGLIVLSEEEKKLHETVIQEMFGLTNLINSKSSIEASLKNARFSHRSFNQNSFQPQQFGKQVKKQVPSGSLSSRSFILKNQRFIDGDNASIKTKSYEEKLSIINTKLNNDDYIYATYQLTRDRIIRSKQKRLITDCRITANKRESSIDGIETKGILEAIATKTHDMDKDTVDQTDLTRSHLNKIPAKDKARGVNRLQQRKLLQPQHKMKDKFTSFFRIGSTSPNNSLSSSCDIVGTSESGICATQIASTEPATSDNSNQVLSPIEFSYHEQRNQHEAFNEHNTETSVDCSTSRYFSVKQDSCDNSMTYALPLARKCSLVSEESGCSNELPEN